MGRPSWASEEQKQWLTGRKLEFLTAQKAGTLQSFITSSTEAFLQQWPQEPSQKMLDDAAKGKTDVNAMLKEFWVEVRTDSLHTHDDQLTFRRRLSESDRKSVV